jgi:hypothetical protein
VAKLKKKSKEISADQTDQVNLLRCEFKSAEMGATSQVKELLGS